MEKSPQAFEIAQNRDGKLRLYQGIAHLEDNRVGKVMEAGRTGLVRRPQ
jgi:hypothetical protein